ncbi:MAG TPA: phosphoribosylamine--glycine ligase N-terminal domain-containing protein, partial [Chryseosolibacter sp.]
MNILVIGNGGREHALAWKISQSPLCDRLFVAPGNTGTASVAENVEIDSSSFYQLGQFCQQNKVELMVVGPEAPLVEGIRDYFESDPGLKDVL